MNRALRLLLQYVHQYIVPILGRHLVFNAYWYFNLWGNKESKSGDGSTLNYTKQLREELPQLLDDLNVRIFLDAPCGDFHWMRCVSFPMGVHYIGGEIVAPMVRKLQKQHGAARRRFIQLDVVRDALPPADLWMCRDLVFHLPNDDIRRLLDNFIDSDIKWLLITSHASGKDVNHDIRPGQFRFVNLFVSPFYLPEPRKKVKDYIDGYPERYLLLYRKDDLLERPWRR